MCIQEGTQLADPARRRRYERLQYLRPPAEMAAVFADLPEALANTVEIARRCSLRLTLGQARLPDYPVPAGTTPTDYLRSETEQGLTTRLVSLGVDTDADAVARYRAQIGRAHV